MYDIHAEVLLSQDFDAEILHELTPEELRDEFGFLKGDIKRIERFRVRTGLAPTETQSAAQQPDDYGEALGGTSAPPAPPAVIVSTTAPRPAALSPIQAKLEALKEARKKVERMTPRTLDKLAADIANNPPGAMAGYLTLQAARASVRSATAAARRAIDAESAALREELDGSATMIQRHWRGKQGRQDAMDFFEAEMHGAR